VATSTISYCAKIIVESYRFAPSQRWDSDGSILASPVIYTIELSCSFLTHFINPSGFLVGFIFVGIFLSIVTFPKAHVYEKKSTQLQPRVVLITFGKASHMKFKYFDLDMPNGSPL
jgi:hypothetical protein